MSLGNHLCAEKNVRSSLSEILKHSVVGHLLCRCVGIHTQNTHVGQIFTYLAFQLLRSVAEVGKPFCTAGGTLSRKSFTVSAHVTKKSATLGIGVVSKRHRAMRAGQNLAALLTADLCGIATSVEEKNRLLVPLISLLKRGIKSRTNGRKVTETKLLTHINDNSLRQACSTVSFTERNQLIYPVFRLVKALKAWCCRGKKH